MKNLIITLSVVAAFLFCPQIVKAQINLLHTFNGNTYSGFQYISQNNSNKYYMTDAVNHQFKLYNEDFSLYKTVNITVPDGYKITWVDHYDSNIFSLDNKIALMVMFTFNGTPTDFTTYSCLQLINEDGTILKDFGFAVSFNTSVHQVSNNNLRLSVQKGIYGSSITYQTEIYSLPGNLSYVQEQTFSSNLASPYPNPSKSIINLPYQLNQGESSVMRIFNINGQLIETKQIDYVYDKIMLNVSNYAKGSYIYEVNNVSNRFIVQ